MRINRGENKNDEWLTPRWVVDALDLFDLDPCCPAVMPWRTATLMIARGAERHELTAPGNGLAIDWKGRVWCNPPYSDILPWVHRAAEHGNAVLLLPAKSPETRWGQTALRTASGVFFFGGRVQFCLPTGESSGKAWGPSMLCLYGMNNVAAVVQAVYEKKFQGQLFLPDVQTRRYQDPAR